ncbi:MAG: hypothetical protein EBR38_00065 [Flavobacteriaceae bacterium]|nr:hypothetical protein [Flavobacteriaceae bacterium]
MTTNTVLLIFLSLLIAGAFSYYNYYYNAKIKLKIYLILAFLRFITVFCILLLLINPIITNKTLEIVKTPLVIAVDNSSSISNLKATKVTKELFKKLASNADLNDKFDIQTYRFDSDFESSANFDFKGLQTNIDAVAKNSKSINKNVTFPTVLITDGNQTSGNDFVFSFDSNNKVFPLVVGDTTTYLDLRVSQLNVNKYAFHKNKFPVEIFLNYSGTKSITSNFSLSLGNTVLYSQVVSFSPSNKSVIISALIPANKIGLQVYKASINSKEKEKNTYNNNYNFAVEVIDQRTEIALITSLNHPDLGALKRAIESNVQRKVTLLKPKELNDFNKYNIVILYQPTIEFKTFFEKNTVWGLNTFIITGTKTDFNFLNQQQKDMVFKMSSQSENYIAEYNDDFNLFALDDIGFDQFPPLENPYGIVSSSANLNVLLGSTIRNINTNSPLFAFSENQGKRTAYLLGENSWKWRLQSHVDTKSYEKYDTFIDKTIQYLATNTTKKSLIVNHDGFYNLGDAIEISAQYFNKNYEFDETANLNITVVNRKTKAKKSYDLLKSNTDFKVNLDGLEVGKYDFIVKEINSKSAYNGYFEILDFDIEKQFVNPNLTKLSQLANQTNGQLIYPDKIDLLIKSLIENEEYKSVQKSNIKKIPLIDWVWLLIILVLCLASEWFLRKYHGML